MYACTHCELAPSERTVIKNNAEEPGLMNPLFKIMCLDYPT